MIIVSQDKTRILNFDNVVVIFFKNENEKFAIYADTNTEQNVHMGNYEEKERAKEVLEEIVNKYAEYKEARSEEFYFAIDYPKVYKMPEE